jgi:hypothetical protein
MATFTAILVASLAVTAVAEWTEGDMMGAYTPATDVTAHAAIIMDVDDIGTALSMDPVNYDSAKGVYTAGGNSMKSSGARTLQGFAQKDQSSEALYLDFHGMYYDEDADSCLTCFEDTYTMSAFEGTGMFEGKSDTIRTTAIKKSLMCTTMMYASHELYDAIKAGVEGETLYDAPHKWDEGWAFYYGSMEGVNSVWEVQGKRDGDFFTEEQTINEANFINGLPLVSAAGWDEVAATAAMHAIEKSWMITFLQATLKYSYLVQDGIRNGDGADEKYWAEGYTYWRCAAGYVHAADPNTAAYIENYLSLNKDNAAGIHYEVYCRVKSSLEALYPVLGIDAADIGVFKDIVGEPCAEIEGDYEPGHEEPHDMEEGEEDYEPPEEGEEGMAGDDGEDDDSAACTHAWF